MRIVFLNPTGTLGGGERSLLDLIASIRAHDQTIEMHLIACDDGPLVEEVRRAGTTAEVLPMPEVLARTGDSAMSRAAFASVARYGVASWRFARALRAAVVAARPDVVHSNGIKTHLLTGMAPPPGTGLVWHVRDFISTRRITSLVLAHLARCRPAIIAVSRAVADDLREVRRDQASIDVIPNAIDTDRFAPGAPVDLDALAEMPPAPRGTLRVGLVATYARWKGHDLFLQAARVIRTRAPNVSIRFYVIGGPIYRTAGSQFTSDELLALAESNDVRDVAGLIPFQDDPEFVYRALDVVVHASTKPEPFGRTIVEAMACGKPVIVSNEGGAAELIRDGHDALAFRPRDATSLAEAIIRLLADPGERARLGAEARRTAVARFSRQRLGPQVLEVYRRACGGLSA